MSDSWILKVDRAEEHLEEFDRQLELYLVRHAYGALRTKTECKEHRKCWRYRLKVTEQPDAKLAVILGDVTHNLRSALDHIAVAIVPPARKRKASFPIVTEDIEDASRPTKLQADARRRFDDAVEGMPAEALSVVRGVQPYMQPGSGVHLLEVLGRLDNADKHRELILLSSGLMNASSSASARRRMWSSAAAADSYVQDGAQLLHFGSDNLWPPLRESEVRVQVLGTQRITLEVGLPPDEALTVDAVHELIPKIRALLAQLEPYVRRPRTEG